METPEDQILMVNVLVEALEVATYPPLNPKGSYVQLHVSKLEALRNAFEALGIDWKAVKKA